HRPDQAGAAPRPGAQRAAHRETTGRPPMTQTTATATAFDLDAITAIDMHVHIEQDSHGCFALDDELMDASAAYFKASEHRAPTLEHVGDYYRQQGMAAVVFTVDATTATGHPTLSSEEIADRAAAYSD